MRKKIIKRAALIIGGIAAFAFYLVLAVCVIWVQSFLVIVIFEPGAGKLNNVKKVTKVVTENQETLQDIVSWVLAPEQEFGVVINCREKKFSDLGYGEETESMTEELFPLEEIYRLAEEMYVQYIYVYKTQDLRLVIFQTYEDGLSIGGGRRGFYYIEPEMTEDIFGSFDINYFYYHNQVQENPEIMDHWYYYRVYYG